MPVSVGLKKDDDGKLPMSVISAFLNSEAGDTVKTETHDMILDQLKEDITDPIQLSVARLIVRRSLANVVKKIADQRKPKYASMKWLEPKDPADIKKAVAKTIPDHELTESITQAAKQVAKEIAGSFEKNAFECILYQLVSEQYLPDVIRKLNE